MVKNVLEIALVHHKPLIEDYDPVCHTGNRIQVMGDKDHRCLVFLLDPQQFVQDLKLSDGVNSCGRFVRDQKGRLHRGRNANHNPLKHSAGELMRVLLQHLLRITNPLFSSISRERWADIALLQSLWAAKVSAIWAPIR